MYHKKIGWFIFALVLFFSKTDVCAQQSGTLDTSFSGDGKAFIQMKSSPIPTSNFHRSTSIATTADRIYLTGVFSADRDVRIGVVALRPDGSLDNTFGFDGKISINPTGGDDVNDIVIQRDNKILLGGSTENDFLIIRLNPDGSLDNSWGGDGSVETDITGTWERITALAITDDGKVIAAGYSGTNVNDITIARYNNDGMLDVSFGNLGSVNIDLQGKDDRIEDIMIQPDGKILVSGSSLRGPGALDGFVIRLTPQGNFDQTFNGSGSTLIPNGGTFTGVAILPDNSIICASSPGGVGAGVYKLKPNGTLDSLFANNGFALGRARMWTENVVYHPSGKIVVFGYTTGHPSRDFAILSFDINGELDACFAEDGVFKVDMVNENEDYLYEGAVQPDGKLVITGEPQERSRRFAVARVHPPVNEDCTLLASNYVTLNDHDLTTITGPSLGSAWADFNDDGLQDLMVANYAGNRNFLFENTGKDMFSNFESEAIVTDLNDSYGVSWGDYNNDGFADLFVSNHSGNNYLYKNTGDSFVKITEGVVTSDITNAWDGAWVDYNNDGLLDIFVATNNQNYLYKNIGNDDFEKITKGNIVNDSEASFGFAWGDYNNDGFADLFVANFGNQNNSLYKNNGDGTFQKILTGSIVNDGGQSRSASWGDYNNDGYFDLYVTNSGQKNFLYRNNGDETFTKVMADPIVNDSYWSFSSVWTDFDNDGFLDMAVVNSTSTDSVSLFRNNQDGTFTKMMDPSLLANGTSSWSISQADFNNDGYEDLYVAGRGNNKGYLFQNINEGRNYVTLALRGTTANFDGIGSRIQIKAGNQWQTRFISTRSGRGSQSSIKVNFGLDQSTMIDSILVYWPGNKRQILTGISVNQELEIKECSSYNLEVIRTLCEGESFTFGDSLLSTSGVYVKSFLTQAGCDSVVNLTLKSVSLDKSVTVQGASIRANQDDAVYQWIDHKGAIIKGATGQYFTPSPSGNYAVIITKDGCTATSDTTSFIVLGLEKKNRLLLVSPNPTAALVSIQLPKRSNAVQVTMFNIAGQEIGHWQFSHRKAFDLDLSEVINGLYLFRIITDDEVFSARVVKD